MAFVKEIPVSQILADEPKLRAAVDSAAQMIKQVEPHTRQKLAALGVSEKEMDSTVAALSKYRTAAFTNAGKGSAEVPTSLSTDSLQGFLSLVHHVQPGADMDVSIMSEQLKGQGVTEPMLGDMAKAMTQGVVKQAGENRAVVEKALDKLQLGPVITDEAELSKQVPAIVKAITPKSQQIGG